jgi:transcriptional regulator with XRE-family HTH domain
MRQQNSQFGGIVPYSVVVGRVLQQRRVQLGLQQNDIATVLGITQSAYSRLESGDNGLSLTQLRFAAAAMQTTAAAVLLSADQYATYLQGQGVQITDEKKDNSAAVLIGLGLLAAAIVAIGTTSQ